jgi:hypothetical protein
MNLNCARLFDWVITSFALKIFCHAALLAGIALAPVALVALPPADSQDSEAALSKSFRCPEEYPSDRAKESALHEFMQNYTARFPNNTIRDMMLFRYRLLVEHSCIQTLNSMLTDVAPLSEMLRFQNQDFGPKTEKYNPETNAWTVWFRKDGQPAQLSEADLIINFYGWPGPSPDIVAKAFVPPRQDIHVIGQFEAPDELTKEPAYFIVSQTLYPDETYGYVNISKITSVGNGTYTVTLTKKITGSSTPDIERKGKAWSLSDEGKAASRNLGNVGVDRSWQEYFEQEKK